jgi:hypothetical protein
MYAIDAGPTTTFTFHVFFGLMSLTRQTANGFHRMSVLPPELDLCAFNAKSKVPFFKINFALSLAQTTFDKVTNGQR